MFARLCTTIRWLGTAMFVAVLIVWGVAVVRPIETTFRLPTLSKTATHRLFLRAYREGLFLLSSRSELQNFGDPRDASLVEVHDSSELMGVFFRHSNTYRGNGFKQFPILPRLGEKTPAERPTATEDFRPSGPPFLSTLILSGHWWHLLTLTLPFAARTTQLSIRRRRTRANPTACKSCGYDLRAGHDKCPECGGESHVPL